MFELFLQSDGHGHSHGGSVADEKEAKEAIDQAAADILKPTMKERFQTNLEKVKPNRQNFNSLIERVKG